MTVGRHYLLKKSTGPSAPKLFFDTQIVPLATNMAGGLELLLDRAARRAGVRPVLILAGSAGIVSFVLYRLLRR
ncbi:hypothetical protein [Aureimonas leprariae]|uniref:Uncharacterized protein n=1 Tax=Plantimonas leprariae TaxID=2615207 RepID=A0A7V7U1M9_9HYPH|nr:hypothetical protein [Aureimonas leprariae]KAB0682082.1 hypothetical protein F6X38_04595 [Aureimonas leprariae]